MLAATAAAALVAVAAVMLTGTGDRADATAVAAAALPAGLPAAAAADLGGADAAPAGASDPADTAGPVTIPTVRTAASSRQQGVRQGTSPETATNTPRATARPTSSAAAATEVDGTPCTSTAKACVDVADREAWLIDKGVVTRGPVQIMTGDNDDPTPLGTFHVQWKAEQYTSRQYLTQMPYSVFFADGGVAFHEGPQDTYSAGCVKLVHDDAVAWFNYLQVGDEVQVH